MYINTYEYNALEALIGNIFLCENNFKIQASKNENAMHHNVTMWYSLSMKQYYLAVALFIFKGCKLREKALVSFM